MRKIVWGFVALFLFALPTQAQTITWQDSSPYADNGEADHLWEILAYGTYTLAPGQTIVQGRMVWQDPTDLGAMGTCPIFFPGEGSWLADSDVQAVGRQPLAGRTYDVRVYIQYSYTDPVTGQRMVATVYTSTVSVTIK